MPPNLKNTGVYDYDDLRDWRDGAETGVVFEERVPNGDWEKYKPTDEWQRRKVGNNLGYDTLSCVTFSALNSLEMQVKYLIDNNKVSPANVALMKHLGYFDENGYPNFSDWFSAIVSGTNENGNYLQALWSSFIQHGVLPQKDGKMVNDFTSQKEWLDPTNITPTMRAKAKMFNEIFDIQYEWVTLGQVNWEQIEKHTKHAPLHTSVPTCKSWNTKNGVVTDCGVQVTNHAILYIGKTDDYKKVLDHYDPFVKKLANNYYVPRTLKGVVNEKKPEVVVPFKYTFTKYLKYGDPVSDELHALQTALQSLKSRSGDVYMKRGVYGYYGDITRTAVGKFQTDWGIPDPDGQGTNFGPKTREAMNRLLST